MFGLQSSNPVARSLRPLARRPFYALACVSSFALALGAVAATLSLVNAVVYQARPLGDDRDVFVLQRLDRNSGRMTRAWSYPRYQEIARALGGAIDRTAIVAPRQVTLTFDGGAGADARAASAELVA